MTDEDLLYPSFEGTVPILTRQSTGILSLDIALGEEGKLGIPQRSIYELYGSEHSGKTTMAVYLASQIRSTGKIAFLDLEYAVDPEWMVRALRTSGFGGTIHVIEDLDKKATKRNGVPTLRTHASMADEAKNLLLQEEYNAIVVDSLGMWVPVLETKSNTGESVVGRRAQEIGQWTRKCLGALRSADDPKMVFMVNHILDKIGGQGHYTPGGKAKGYGAEGRLLMWRSNNDYSRGCFEVTLKVEKLRHGGRRKDQFGFAYIVPGLGVSRGMSAYLDCVRYGYVSNSGGWVKFNGEYQNRFHEGKSYCRTNELEEAAYNGDTEIFQPFLEIVEEQYGSRVSIS